MAVSIDVTGQSKCYLHTFCMCYIAQGNMQPAERLNSVQMFVLGHAANLKIGVNTNIVVAL